MHTDKVHAHDLLMEVNLTGNSYFGNPYMLGYEQYGMEHVDRHNNNNEIGQDADEVESVVILGYN